MTRSLRSYSKAPNQLWRSVLLWPVFWYSLMLVKNSGLAARAATLAVGEEVVNVSAPLIGRRKLAVVAVPMRKEG